MILNPYLNKITVIARTKQMFEVTEKILNSKLNQHKKWLSGEEEGYNIVLTSCLIQNYDFKDRDLSKGSFVDCEFINCNFSKANLEQAEFTDSKLTECNFRNNFSNFISFSNSDLVGCAFISSTLSNLNFESSTFKDCDFNDAKLGGGRFQACNLQGHDFSGCDLRDANFYGSNLTDVNFTGAQLKQASFIAANCTNANFTDTIVYKTNFMKSNLTGANLTNINVDATVGNGSEIKSLQSGGRYVTWTSDYVWVDCMKGPIKPFLTFKAADLAPLLKILDENGERLQTERESKYYEDKEALSSDSMEWVENYSASAIAFVKKNLATKTTQ